ncbi:hypothetical protein EWM64_g388 [Hericium alpestre]|uniref:Cytochrome P450 n=1 Tax=Hericium alpestre TaxID=135208 RepID=A0A4Z0ABB2_9AGAM|nr:hypothetical protein EWM64_g388 [Hericium alpestre]
MLLTGPTPIPFVGNLHQIPMVDQFTTYVEWAKTYGPLMYFHVFGREFVVVNDLKGALELFEGRSGLYCTKPRLVMAGELIGKQKSSMIFSHYNARLKKCHQITHNWMGKQSIRWSWRTQEIGAYKLLESLLDDPEHFSEHVRTHAGTVLLGLIYGIKCLPVNDPHIALSEHVCGLTAEAMRPGRWLVDSFPLLAYVPDWFPGAHFKRWARQTRAVTNRLIRGPYEMVRASVLDGTAPPSWVADAIITESGQPIAGEDAECLIVAAGSLYAAGIDTTVSAIRTFFLMMARHPEVQRKAQAEIDKVIGTSRLPNVEDKDSLPYLNCITKEVLRVAAIVPVMPHSLERDDIYEGYLIPKGSFVMVNTWAIFHDPQTYPDPEQFKPERFDPALGDAAQMDPEVLGFGLGRRSCAGMHFAKSWLFLNLSYVLSVFDILPAKGADGKPSVPEVRFDAGHIRIPSEFKCLVVPRNVDKVRLVREVVATSKED